MLPPTATPPTFGPVESPPAAADPPVAVPARSTTACPSSNIPNGTADTPSTVPQFTAHSLCVNVALPATEVAVALSASSRARKSVRLTACVCVVPTLCRSRRCANRWTVPSLKPTPSRASGDCSLYGRAAWSSIPSAATGANPGAPSLLPALPGT